MAKVLDITEKLSFEGNPCLMIKEKKIEVNADAPTMLKVMGLMSTDDPGADEVLETYRLIFPEISQKKIEALKLNFADLVIVIQSAIQLVTGGEEGQGEQ